MAGTLAPLRGILAAFLSNGKLRLGKMRKLVGHVLGQRVAMKRHSEYARLLAAVGEWAQAEPEAGLRRLLDTLRGLKYNMAGDLEIKISEIEKQMRHCEAAEKN